MWVAIPALARKLVNSGHSEGVAYSAGKLPSVLRDSFHQLRCAAADDGLSTLPVFHTRRQADTKEKVIHTKNQRSFGSEAGLGSERAAGRQECRAEPFGGVEPSSPSRGLRVVVAVADEVGQCGT